MLIYIAISMLRNYCCSFPKIANKLKIFHYTVPMYEQGGDAMKLDIAYVPNRT